MYWEAKMRIHQHKHTLAEPCLFVLRVIYNKQYCRCIVRFKLNRGPSACRTVCGQWRTVGFVFFPRTVPSLIFSFMFTEICNYFKIYSFREKNHIFVFFIKIIHYKVLILYKGFLLLSLLWITLFYGNIVELSTIYLLIKLHFS